MKRTKFILFLLITLSFNSCFFLWVKKKFTKEDLRFVSWIKPNMELIFKSNKDSVVKYELLIPKDYYEKCSNWPESCTSDSYRRTYDYRKTTSDTVYTFTFIELDKERNKTTTELFF